MSTLEDVEINNEDIEKCLESGMNDHLAKPIDLDAVLDKFSFCCESAKNNKC